MWVKWGLVAYRWEIVGDRDGAVLIRVVSCGFTAITAQNADIGLRPEPACAILATSLACMQNLEGVLWDFFELAANERNTLRYSACLLWLAEPLRMAWKSAGK